MTLSERVCAVIERETGQKVTASTLLDDLNVDSLEFMALTLEISKELDSSIEDDRLGELKTVGDLIVEFA